MRSGDQGALSKLLPSHGDKACGCKAPGAARTGEQLPGGQETLLGGRES